MSDTAELYHNLIMARSKTPRFASRPTAFDAEGEGDNPMCGDHVHVYICDHGAQISHEARGCAILTASADLMAEATAGQDRAKITMLHHAFEKMVTTGIENPTLGALNALAGVSQYRSRIRCATLPWSALAQALEKDR